MDLPLILRKRTSQIIFYHYTNGYCIVTRWHFPNCKIYLLSDGISNWAHIFTDIATVVYDIQYMIKVWYTVYQTLITRFFWSGDWTILECQITDDFLQFQTSKSISSENIFGKWLKFLSSTPQNICKRRSQAFLQLTAETRNMIFLVIFQKNPEKKCFDFFESRLKRELMKHWWESWLSSSRYFEVLVVKFEQTLFFNFIF